jgi:phosphate transport system substrate-binding protein
MAYAQALLPNANITVVGRSDGSGTTAIFTSGLSRFSAQFNASVGPSELVNWGNASNVAATPRNFILPSSRFVVRRRDSLRHAHAHEHSRSHTVAVALHVSGCIG